MGPAGPTIHVIGNVNVDLILGPVAQWPRMGTEIVLPHSDIRVGGAAGNVALALAALSAPHRLYGNCGSDVFGDWLAGALGAAMFADGRLDGPTTVSVGVVHPHDERTFLTSAGHLDQLTLDHLRPGLDQARPGDVAILLGTFLSPRLLDRYEELLSLLEARGLRIALDTGWPPQGWTDALRARVMSWLPRCDFLFFNEIETMGLAGVEDLEAAGDALAARAGAAAVVVTKRGPAGAVGRHGALRHAVAAPPVAVVDTIGAGDIFNGAFLCAWLAGRGLTGSLTEAVAVASQAIATSPRRIARVDGVADGLGPHDGVRDQLDASGAGLAAAPAAGPGGLQPPSSQHR